MRARIFLVAVGAVVTAAILAGIFTAGGPLQARRDAYDQARLEDLRFIAAALACTNERILTPVLPEDLTVESLRAYCGGVEVAGPELTDNETGAPYEYLRLSETEYRVCARFQDAGRAMRLSYSGYRQEIAFTFDPMAGCVSGRIR